MSRTLNLLCFKQSRWFPRETAHWALYLFETGTDRGVMFHAGKEAHMSTDYERVPNYKPTGSQSLQHSVEVASGLTLSYDDLNAICSIMAHNRHFDLAVFNCQRFCTEVLRRLVSNGTITQEQFDALRTKGFQPLF